MKAEANKTQVGGKHYQGKSVQHWDLVVVYDWDYFQAQITKYIMRWKDKHNTPEKRLEDLKKARHFLDKYIENARYFDRCDHIEEERLPGCLDDSPCVGGPTLEYVDQDR